MTIINDFDYNLSAILEFKEDSYEYYKYIPGCSAEELEKSKIKKLHKGRCCCCTQAVAIYFIGELIMDGQNLKKQYLDKRIRIYQMPLFERILAVFSAIVLTVLPITCIALGVPQKMEMIILLFVMLFYSLFVFFSVFETYISLDFEKGNLIIKEFPGIRKQEIDLSYIKSISITEGSLYKGFYTIDINIGGNIKKISSWSTPLESRLLIFNRYKRQIKRLKKFTDNCNKQLNIDKK